MKPGRGTVTKPGRNSNTWTNRKYMVPKHYIDENFCRLTQSPWRLALTISHVKLPRHTISVSPQLPHLCDRECYFYSYSYSKTLITETADVTLITVLFNDHIGHCCMIWNFFFNKIWQRSEGGLSSPQIIVHLAGGHKLKRSWQRAPIHRECC